MGDVSWEELLSDQIRLHSRLFFRLARNILRDEAAADDVCQRAFMQAWEQRKEINPASLKSWLARTVINGSLQIVRRGKIEVRANAAHAQWRATTVQEPGRDAELREAVLAAVEQLPEHSRAVVVMRLMQGMSGGEVKELLGCSASEVSRQLHRGLDALRQTLADCHADVAQ